MVPHDPYDFDIDVDVSQLLGRVIGPTLIDARWYELVAPRPGRPPHLQAKLDQMFENLMLRAQWRASGRRRLDRRRAVRVPLLSRVHVANGSRLLACDISLSGLRASGDPTAPLMDVEFKLPGLGFPVDARVEVVSYKKANVIPLVGLRFAWIDKRYIDQIAAYICRRQQGMLQAA